MSYKSLMSVLTDIDQVDGVVAALEAIHHRVAGIVRPVDDVDKLAQKKIQNSHDLVPLPDAFADICARAVGAGRVPARWAVRLRRASTVSSSIGRPARPLRPVGRGSSR